MDFQMDFSIPLYALHCATVHSTDSEQFFEENLENLSRFYMTKNKRLAKKYLEKLDEDVETDFTMNKNFILRYGSYDVYFYNNDGEEDTTHSHKKVVATYKSPTNKLKIGLVSGYDMDFIEDDDDAVVGINEKFTIKRAQQCPNEYLNKIVGIMCDAFKKVKKTMFHGVEIDEELYHSRQPEDPEPEPPLPLTGELFECPISIEEYDTSLSVKTPCGHTFHKDNLKEWMNQRWGDKCPLCRSPLN